MSDSQTPTVDPYDGQRTTPGPVHPPRYPMNPPVDFESPDTFLQGFPYEAFSGVHESAPIFWHPETKPYEPGFWVLTRFEDVRQVSKDPTLFSSAKGAGPMLSFEGSGYDMTPEMLTIYRANMVGMDPPVHRAYRSVVAPYLSGPAVKRLESAIQDRVSALLDAIEVGRPFDLVQSYSAVTPAVALCHLLGVPPQDHQRIIDWGDALAGAEDPEYAAVAMSTRAEAFVRPGCSVARAAPRTERDAMRWSEITVVVTIVLALVLWWLWVAASRLDRLHRKVGTSRAVLDAQLIRRATVAAELATSGLLDPVSSVLVGEAAWAALSTGASELPADLRALLGPDDLPPGGAALLAVDRGGIESELSATLREALDDPDEVAALRADPAGDELVDLLASSWYRVQLARRFSNEAVVSRPCAPDADPWSGCCGWRVTRPSRTSLELDDAWPENLGRPGTRRGPVEGTASR